MCDGFIGRTGVVIVGIPSIKIDVSLVEIGEESHPYPIGGFAARPLSRRTCRCSTAAPAARPKNNISRGVCLKLGIEAISIVYIERQRRSRESQGRSKSNLPSCSDSPLNKSALLHTRSRQHHIRTGKAVSNHEFLHDCRHDVHVGSMTLRARYEQGTSTG